MIRGVLVGLGAGIATLAIAIALFVGLGGGDGDTAAYRMPSESMEPTLSAGEIVTVDLEAYESAEPEIGDIITFNPPLGAEEGRQCGSERSRDAVCPLPTPERSDQLFIKRIVALPGDELALVEGELVVNGEPASEDFTRPCRGESGCDLREPVTIPPGHYFVLGDNRPASDDSRFWGPVPQEWIHGRLE